MRILVTGGAGFIGSHVVDALVSRRHHVTVLDDLSTGKHTNIHQKARLVKMDVRSPRITSLLRRTRPDTVFHFAAQKDARLSVQDPVQDAETNIIGLLNVVRAALDVRIKKFILASTGGAIYGGARRVPTPETYPAHPLSPYGVSKLASEHYLHAYRHAGGFPMVSLRLANVYGPRQDSKSEAGVVAIWIGQLLAGKRPTIYGDGRQTRDFVYVADVVRAFLVAMKPGVTGIYNIGTGRETTIDGLYRHVARAAGSSIAPIYGSPQAGEELRSAVDARLAAKVLGWRPQVSLEAGIKKTVAWFKRKKS